MALDAGVIAVTVEFAQGLKDHDWFGRQDPYVIVRCGGQQFRSRTATDGGRNPVWNQTFQFNVINENSIDILLKDEDVLSRDDVIGNARVDLARCRLQGVDHQQVPVITPHRQKQRGFVSVSLKWSPNYNLRPNSYTQPMSYGMPPAPYPATTPYPMPQPSTPYGMPPAGYPAPYGAPQCAPQYVSQYPPPQYAPQYPALAYQQPMAQPQYW